MDTTVLLIILIVFLLAIDIFLAVALVASIRMQSKERKELINRIVAKSTGELIQLTQVDKKPTDKPKGSRDPMKREIEKLMESGYLDS